MWRAFVFTERRVAGGREAQTRTAGETRAVKTLTAMIVVTVMIAVVTVVTETVGTTVTSEAHPENKMMVSRAS